MLKEPTTYEIMRPEDVGFPRTELVLGKHSGRAALADRARALGFHLTAAQLQTVFDEFKELADKKKEIYDGDIAALIKKTIHDAFVEDEWSLVSFQLTSGTGQKPRIRLTLRHGDQEFTEELSDGDGPVDAAFLATEKITGLTLVCKDFQVRSATLGPRCSGRSQHRSGVPRPDLPWSRRVDRLGRSQRPGDPQHSQSNLQRSVHRASTPPLTCSATLRWRSYRRVAEAQSCTLLNHREGPTMRILPHPNVARAGHRPLSCSSRRFRRMVFTAWCVVQLVASQGSAAAPPVQLNAPPNIVFILADDMGYGDVHALNPSSKIPTPHLDALAAAGMTFTDAHSPSAVCTPTRYGLLTGRYCFRTRLKRGVLDGYSAPLIDRGQPTVASLLQQHQYSTGVVGKWHLGLAYVRGDGDQPIDYRQPVTHGPNDVGFDDAYIIPASLDFPPYVYLHNGLVTEPELVSQPAQTFPAFLRAGPRSQALQMEQCLDHLTDQALRFIEQQSQEAEPFFLYFALTAPHKPVLPHPRYRGRTALGPYGDFIVQVDDCVGRVIRMLDQAGLRETTLLFYSSDNGSFMYRREGRDHVEEATVQAFRPEHHTANGPWRGTKADIWEGGHHVPLLVRWPGQVKAGSVCTTPVCLVDLLATAAELVGAERPTSAQDSHSLLPLLRGQPDAQRPPVIHHSANGMFAIRDGRWKLVLGNGSGGREPPLGRPFTRPYQLFDLSQDPTESHNRITDHPEVARRLEAQALALIGPDR